MTCKKKVERTIDPFERYTSIIIDHRIFHVYIYLRRVNIIKVSGIFERTAKFLFKHRPDDLPRLSKHRR